MMIISQDNHLLEVARGIADTQTVNIRIVNDSSDPLEIMAAVCSHKPALLILDDDFLKPHSAHTLASIKKVHKHTEIIFVTSDAGIELGREVSQLGIHYYGFKPLEASELEDAVRSLINKKSHQH